MQEASICSFLSFFPVRIRSLLKSDLLLNHHLKPHSATTKTSWHHRVVKHSELRSSECLRSYFRVGKGEQRHRGNDVSLMSAAGQSMCLFCINCLPLFMLLLFLSLSLICICYHIFYYLHQADDWSVTIEVGGRWRFFVCLLFFFPICRSRASWVFCFSHLQYFIIALL